MISRASRKALVTAYQNRRWGWGDFVTLKDVIASSELGRIVSYESHFDRYRSEPKLDVWRENGGPGGGTLFDLGPHLIDQATVLFGERGQPVRRCEDRPGRGHG